MARNANRTTPARRRAILELAVTEAGAIIASEIQRSGPLPFSRFMEIALYHPVSGYYAASRNPFGVRGDFYTAAQLQPVFGRLLRRWVEDCGADAVIDLGAGRQDLAPAFAGLRYVPIDIHNAELPSLPQAAVVANEFFDALPCDVYQLRSGELRQLRVTCDCGVFEWVLAEPATPEVRAWVAVAAASLQEGQRIEVCLAYRSWMEKLARALDRASIFINDYGYTRDESHRFPQGTLMSYRRHQATPDVFADPGQRDITAHVAFSVLEMEACRAGFTVEFFGTLSSILLRWGERDQFSEIVRAPSPQGERNLRLQLKTLLYGMGETFRVLLLSKAPQTKNGPDCSGP